MDESSLQEVDVSSLKPDVFGDVLEPRAMSSFLSALEKGRDLLGDHTLWHVNSTAQGGGVAEVIQSALGYLAGGGIRARRLVIGGDEEFFELTKRVHNFLHGESGDGVELGVNERRIYEDTLRSQEDELRRLVEPGDVVVVHDPQPVGLVPLLRDRRARVIWNCHIGVDAPNEVSGRAWDFLRRYASAAHAHVFSRRAYVWEGLDDRTVSIIPPCIDAFSPKNQPLEDPTVIAILGAAGVMKGDPESSPKFRRQDGSEAEVSRSAEVVEEQPIDPSSPILLQVSRWDRLKDPIGVLRGFAEHVVDKDLGAQLILAGPASGSVTDDPEAEEVLGEVRKVRDDLPGAARSRVHLVCVPMEDPEENAAIVNALQRRADVIVQKSLAEGFGLTVAEGMWKERPVVGTRVGGIQDQIEHGRSGLLVDDPEDAAEFGAAVTSLLHDREGAARMGQEARRRVLDEYLAPRYITRYIELIDRVVASEA